MDWTDKINHRRLSWSKINCLRYRKWRNSLSVDNKRFVDILKTFWKIEMKIAANWLLAKDHELQKHSYIISYCSTQTGFTFFPPSPSFTFFPPSPSFTFFPPSPSFTLFPPSHSFTFFPPSPSFTFFRPSPSFTFFPPSPSFTFFLPSPSFTFFPPSPIFTFFPPSPSFTFFPPSPSSQLKSHAFCFRVNNAPFPLGSNTGAHITQLDIVVSSDLGNIIQWLSTFSQGIRREYMFYVR